MTVTVFLNFLLYDVIGQRTSSLKLRSSHSCFESSMMKTTEDQQSSGTVSSYHTTSETNNRRRDVSGIVMQTVPTTLGWVNILEHDTVTSTTTTASLFNRLTVLTSGTRYTSYQHGPVEGACYTTLYRHRDVQIHRRGETAQDGHRNNSEKQFVACSKVS
ncbi:hypothetical protein J6590_041055 [Homalodisca vitripennis]|nr:hypothetical protein J6590_041055 [Homalodisca vitripennis]